MCRSLTDNYRINSSKTVWSSLPGVRIENYTLYLSRSNDSYKLRGVLYPGYTLKITRFIYHVAMILSGLSNESGVEKPLILGRLGCTDNDGSLSLLPSRS